MVQILLASHNEKKLDELRRILRPLVPDVQVLGLNDIGQWSEPAETEPTFAGNALVKARAALAATGLPSLADDSGICVDELNGMPGVLSARWSGRGDAANNALLLHQLADTPDERRGAQFTCVMAFCAPDGTEVTETGTMPGRILRAERGDHGFGYDPLFAAEGYESSTAELDDEEKDRISHRGKALRAIVPQVAAVLHDRSDE